MTLRAALICCACIGLMAATARAQDADAEARARELFESGVTAVRGGNVEEGRRMLEESLAHHPSLPTRFNLAIAIREDGEPARAARMFEELLRGDHGELRDEQRGDLERQLEATRARVGHLRVRLSGLAEATIVVDGEEVGTIAGVEPLQTDVDPGEHLVVAEGATSVPPQRVSVAAGATTEVVLVGPAPTSQGEPPPTERDPAPDPSTDEGSGLPAWPFVLGAVALAGAVAGILIAVLVPIVDAPISDPVTGLTTTLSF